ncbi:MAG: hypothetical protein KJZ70_09665 [Bryobacterales bacterium]|nr:hypothetical protein [Bryobacterales bacterium]
MQRMIVPYITGSADRFERLARIASVQRMDLFHIQTVAELEDWLRSQRTPALITDSQFEDGDWQDALEYCRSHAPEVRVVVTARTDSPSLLAEVAEAGAVDLIAQPFYAPEVRRCLRALADFVEREQFAEATA